MAMFHTLVDMVIVVRMIVIDYGKALGLSQVVMLHLSLYRKDLDFVVLVGKEVALVEVGKEIDLDCMVVLVGK